MTEVLNDVRSFMRENHHELVLLKFSHFSGIDAGRYRAMTDLINRTLQPWLYSSLPPGRRLVDIPLRDFIQDDGKILLFIDGSFPVDHPLPGFWVYRDWDSQHPEQGDLRVFDQYANMISPASMKADQLKKFEACDGRCKHRPDLPCDLFLLSWTLTPPTDVLGYARPLNARLEKDLPAFKFPNRFGQRINLLYTDDSTAAITDAALGLNER